MAQFKIHCIVEHLKRLTASAALPPDSNISIPCREQMELSVATAPSFPGPKLSCEPMSQLSLCVMKMSSNLLNFCKYNTSRTTESITASPGLCFNLLKMPLV
jgi:hypothetical protein